MLVARSIMLCWNLPRSGSRDIGGVAQLGEGGNPARTLMVPEQFIQFGKEESGRGNDFMVWIKCRTRAW